MTKNKPVTITLTLTGEEWSELANALESKARLIERGDYGEEESPGENAAWIACLLSAYRKVTDLLDKNGVVH